MGDVKSRFQPASAPSHFTPPSPRALPGKGLGFLAGFQRTSVSPHPLVPGPTLLLGALWPAWCPSLRPCGSCQTQVGMGWLALLFPQSVIHMHGAQGLAPAMPPSERTGLTLPSYSLGTSDPLDMQHGFWVGREERAGLQKPL